MTFSGNPRCVEIIKRSLHSKTPIPSVTYLAYLLYGDWKVTVQSLLTTVGINCAANGSVVTVLPAVVNSDYTVTVQSLYSHYA